MKQFLKFNIGWVICTFLFLLHQIFSKIGKLRISFIDNYLDPILFLPIILGAWLFEWRYVIKEDVVFKFPKLLSGMVALLLVVVVECLFPILNKGFTFDYWDFICYGIGLIIYWRYIE